MASMNSIMLKVFCVFVILQIVKAEFSLKDEDLRGIYAATFTPMDEDGNLNLTAIGPYADYLKKNGVKGVLVNAITGEGAHLTLDEKKQMVDAWVAQKDRCGFSIIVETHAFPDAPEMACYSEQKKVDAIIVKPDPYYQPTSVSELVHYIQVIARKANNTAIIYYDPCWNTDVDVMKLFTKATRDIPNFVGLDIEMDVALKIISNHLLKENQRLFIHSNYFVSIYGMWMNGSISIGPNLFPGQLSAIKDDVENGKLDSARSKQFKFNEWFSDSTVDEEHIFSGPSIASLKTAMSMTSCIDVGPVRSPLQRTSEKQRKMIARKLREDGASVDC